MIPLPTADSQSSKYTSPLLVNRIHSYFFWCFTPYTQNTNFISE